MTNERWEQLSDEPDDKKAVLTPEEIAEGWHWCNEFDGLLRQPVDAEDKGNPEAFKCDCLEEMK